MYKIIAAVVLTGLAPVVSSLASEQKSAEEAVRARVLQYEAAYNAGHVDSVAAIYTVDGTHTYANGVTHRGRVEIANGLKDQFAGPLNGTQISITPIHIRPLSANIAVEEAAFVLTGLKNTEGTNLPPVDGLCLVIYQKQGEQWYIAAAQCMVPPPVPK